VLLSIVLMFTTVGAYALANRTFDVVAILFCGLLGFFFYKFKVPTPPFIIGFILGGMAEENLRRGLILSNDSFLDFFAKPITAVLLVLTIAYLVYVVVKNSRKQKEA